MNVYIPIPHKLPVVIFSTPRTGSRLLGDLIESKFRTIGSNIRFWSEPDKLDQTKIDSKPTDHNSLKNFYDYAIASNNYILKVHWCNFCKIYDKKIVDLNNAYLIRIKRKDIIAQLTSWYIARYRNIWRYTSSHNIKDLKYTDPISIEFDLLDHAMLNLNLIKELETVQLTFDLDLWYEDISSSDNFESLVTPNPCNYQEIYETIRERVIHHTIYNKIIEIRENC